jgi:hypothetical protein
MIACTRQIVTDGTQPQSIDTLRGTDREIADVFVEAGFDVAVRACIVGDDREGGDAQFPVEIYGVTRLSSALPADVLANMGDVVSFTDEAEADEADGFEATLLGEWVLDTVDMNRWVVRKRAAATTIYEGMYSENGYFGNEASFGQLYTLAAIEVTRR